MGASRAAGPVRLAILGGNRGRGLVSSLERLADRVQLTAIADSDPTVRARWVAEHPGLRSHATVDELLADDDVDAVAIATPIELHAEQAIAALAADKHVLCEILAVSTVAEAHRLVAAADASARVYMMAENSCFTRTNLRVAELAAQGAFGRITYLAGSYLHDTRDLLFSSDGELTWRGRSRASTANISYPTHALGPLLHWLSAANGTDDRPATLVAVNSAAQAVPAYVSAVLGPDHPGASPDAWRRGDTGSVLITTTAGAVIHVRVDSASPRPHSIQTTHHELQGSRGVFLGSRQVGEDGLVWFEGDDIGPQPWTEDAAEKYLPLASQPDHPLWERYFGNRDATHGHGGGDLLVLERFLSAIDGSSPNPIDARAAATWSVVADLSAQSIAAGGALVPFPQL